MRWVERNNQVQENNYRFVEKRKQETSETSNEQWELKPADTRSQYQAKINYLLKGKNKEDLPQILPEPLLSRSKSAAWVPISKEQLDTDR